MTIKQYLADSTSIEGLVTVTEIVSGAEKPTVRLERTWFHPQGGGQKADRGSIGSSTVLHVAHNNGVVEHYVDTIGDLVVGKKYVFSIDRKWRLLNAVYHTAGHLIASVIDAEGIGLHAVSGHQWPGEGRVEFEGDTPALNVISDLLRTRISEAIAKDFPVTVVGDPFSERAIKIGDYLPIPCGGTHVQSLGEIGKLDVSSVKKKGPRVRVSYDAAPITGL